MNDVKKPKKPGVGAQNKILRKKLSEARAQIAELHISLYHHTDAQAAESRRCDRVSTENGRLRAALISMQVNGFVAEWNPTHVHRKSGGLYRVIRRGTLESTMQDVVIYDTERGKVWVRPAYEFDDGRFLAILPETPKKAPPAEADGA